MWITGLGEVRRVVRPPIGKSILNGALYVFFWTLFTLMFGFVAGFILGAVASVRWEQLAVVGTIWGASLGLVGYWLGAKVFSVVVVYEGGVAVRDHRRVAAWAWEDIESVEVIPFVSRPEISIDPLLLGLTIAAAGARKMTGGTLTRVIMRYRFRDVLGRTFGLDDWLSDPNGLASILVKEVAQRQTPRARAALAAGELISFGAVTVSTSGGVDLGERCIGWSDLHSVAFDQETFHFIGLDGKRLASVPLRQIRNPTVLMDLLLDELGREGLLVHGTP